MSASRIFSVAAVAAFASFAAQADTYGAHFQDEVQSTRTRAEVHAEAVKAGQEDGRDQQVAEDMAGAVRAADISQGGTGAPFARNLHGDRAADRHRQMLARAPDHDQEGGDGIA